MEQPPGEVFAEKTPLKGPDIELRSEIGFQRLLIPARLDQQAMNHCSRRCETGRQSSPKRRDLVGFGRMICQMGSSVLVELPLGLAEKIQASPAEKRPERLPHLPAAARVLASSDSYPRDDVPSISGTICQDVGEHLDGLAVSLTKSDHVRCSQHFDGGSAKGAVFVKTVNQRWPPKGAQELLEHRLVVGQNVGSEEPHHAFEIFIAGIRTLEPGQQQRPKRVVGARLDGDLQGPIDVVLQEKQRWQWRAIG